MNNDHLFNVTIKPGEKDSSGIESFQVNCTGADLSRGPHSAVRSRVRLLPVGDNFTVVFVDQVEFENIAEDDKVQFALLIPEGFVRYWGLRTDHVAVFDGEFARIVPYMWNVTQAFPELADARVAHPQFIGEANANLASRGYRFRLAPEEAAVKTPEPKVPTTVENPQQAIEEVVAVVGEMTTPVKKMRISFDGKQALIVGNNITALGEAISVEFRHKHYGEKFEVVAVDTIQVVGMDNRDGLALAYGALSLATRLNPDLPLELAITKPGLDALNKLLPELDEQSKWNSHLSLFLLNGEYIKQEIERVAAKGYVAELTK